MAKAVRATGAPRTLPVASARGNYLKEVWEELKKVLWPTRTELTRMTGIVIATVFIFAGIIGVADYGLGLVVKQLYAAPGTAQKAPIQAPAVPTVPRRSAPATSAPAVPAPAGSAPAVPAPAAPATSAPAAPPAAAPATSAPAIPAPVPQP